MSKEIQENLKSMEETNKALLSKIKVREECCLEILESYVEFIDIILNDKTIVSDIIAIKRKQDWAPELENLRKHLKLTKDRESDNGKRT